MSFGEAVKIIININTDEQSNPAAKPFGGGRFDIKEGEEYASAETEDEAMGSCEEYTADSGDDGEEKEPPGNHSEPAKGDGDVSGQGWSENKRDQRGRPF